MKKFVKWFFIVIAVLIGIFFIIGILAPGDIKVKSNSNDGVDGISYFDDDYITDENYQPEEVDLLGHVLSTLHHLDLHEWQKIDDKFQDGFAQEAALAEEYGVMKTNPEKINSISYIVEDKKFTAYFQNNKVEPIEVDESNGVLWKTFPYDVWIEFSFTVTRVIELEGEKKKDKFNVSGTYPPLWLPSKNETHWSLGSLMISPVE